MGTSIFDDAGLPTSSFRAMRQHKPWVPPDQPQEAAPDSDPVKPTPRDPGTAQPPTPTKPKMDEKKKFMWAALGLAAVILFFK